VTDDMDLSQLTGDIKLFLKSTGNMNLFLRSTGNMNLFLRSTGDIRGPPSRALLLFLVYVNDMKGVTDCNLILYTNDSALMISDKN
jgi:hypothetical protein